LTAVFAVVMVGISIGVAAKQWSTVVQRDREEELLFRGNQIKHAIEAYYRDAAAPVPGVAPQPGNRSPMMQYPGCGMEGNDCFKDLLGDPTSRKKRYLRKAYKDPVTNDDWLMIKTANNRLIGVRSKSLKEPYKKANFPEEYKCFEQAEAYIDWVFRFVPVTAQPGGETNVALQEEPCTILERPHSIQDKDSQDRDSKDNKRKGRDADR
jgi:type II secretory pathway pseudopilin PulG